MSFGNRYSAIIRNDYNSNNHTIRDCVKRNAQLAGIPLKDGESLAGNRTCWHALSKKAKITVSKTVKFGSLVPELVEKLQQQPNQANLFALTANVHVGRGLTSTATSERIIMQKLLSSTLTDCLAYYY